jgi:hypothetical protein
MWKTWVFQHLISHYSSDVPQPLAGWRPGKPPGWSAPQTPDLPVIHAFSFTNFYVMIMAIDIACQVKQQQCTSGVSVSLPVSGSKWRTFQLKLNDIRFSPHSPLPHYYTQHGAVRYPVSKAEVTAVLFNQSQNRECYGLQIIFKPSTLFPFTADYPSNGPWGTVKPSMTPSLSIMLLSFRGSLLPPPSRTNNKYFLPWCNSGPKPPHCRGFTITHHSR